MCQRKQKQIEKDVIRKNFTQIDYDLIIEHNVMVRKTRLINMKHRFKVRMK